MPGFEIVADLALDSLPAAAPRTATHGYWGPHFPDSLGRTFTSDPTFASLALADVTSGPNFVDAVVTALVEGTAGNSRNLAFLNDVAIEATEYMEETSTDTIVHFMSGSSTVETVQVLLAGSVYVEMTGSWDVEAVLSASDEFTLTPLAGGLGSVVGGRVAFWGAHFSDFEAISDVVFAPGPSGIATFALALEGVKLTLSWANDVFKAHLGRENRSSDLTNPKQKFQGTVTLLGDDRADIRALLRRFAQEGTAFFLGLPYEGVPIILDSTDEFVRPSRVDLEWMGAGQRVLVFGIDDGDTATGVIQSVTATDIELDIVSGTAGKRGAIIMPIVPVLLDAQQSFQRYPNEAEEWQLSAVCATFGWTRSATLDLSTVDVVGTALDGITLTSRLAGEIGNGIEITLVADSDPGDGVVLDEADGAGYIHVEDDATTVADFVSAMESSVLVRASGDFDPEAIIDTFDDMFSAAALSGGGCFDTGELTATVNTFEDRPVWDRYIQVDGTVSDSMQSLTETIDLGGIPFTAGTASAPEWGRQVTISRTFMDEYLWLRCFLHTVRGQQVAFWLPTWREDLRAAAPSDGSDEISIEFDFGDFYGWFPDYRMIQILQGTTLLWLYVDSAVTVGSTITLTVHGPTLPSAAAIDAISWMELCRFESPDFDIEFEGPKFTMSATARVVQR